MAVVPESATIINALRSGLVPAQGLEHFATGLDPLLAAVNEELDFVATGKELPSGFGASTGRARPSLLAICAPKPGSDASPPLRCRSPSTTHLCTIWRLFTVG